jgi:phosphoribosyl-ATP pyrophosphohydrolase
MKTFTFQPGTANYFQRNEMSGILHELYATICERRDEATAASYTARLFAEGDDRIIQKVGEEAVEVILAAKGQSEARLVSETADLLYHLLVLLASRDVRLDQVEAELVRRRK